MDFIIKTTNENDRNAIRHIISLLTDRLQGYGIEAAEVGSFTGDTANLMLESRVYKLFCVDRWDQPYNDGDTTSNVYKDRGGLEVLKTFCENMGDRLFSTVFPCRGTSLEWADVFKAMGKQFDLVYIDAAHDYESVTRDITKWWPLVKPGGILAGHDFGDGWPDVMRAVIITGDVDKLGDSVWMRRKP